VRGKKYIFLPQKHGLHFRNRKQNRHNDFLFPSFVTLQTRQIQYRVYLYLGRSTVTAADCVRSREGKYLTKQATLWKTALPKGPKTVMLLSTVVLVLQGIRS